LGTAGKPAIGAIFIGGVLFTLLTVFKLRSWLTDQIPEGLKVSFAVGIGFFLAFIGLNEAEIVVLGAPGAPVHVGNFGQTSALLSVFCFILILFLITKKVRAAILSKIIITTFLAIITKLHLFHRLGSASLRTYLPFFLSFILKVLLSGDLFPLSLGYL
jgi:AGZA family xanthine/uracil permease-like MFS transporter